MGVRRDGRMLLLRDVECDETKKIDKEVMMKNMLFGLSLCFSLTACVTMSGSYRVTATDKDGAPIPSFFEARGGGIYTARNAFCVAYPGAKVSIVDLASGKELSSESPYKCK